MPEEIKITETNFICKTLFHLNTIKGFHWQTESYAEHQVLDLYHNKLTELIDKFVETLKEFKPTTITQQIDIYIDKADVIEIIKEYQEKIRDIRASLNSIKENNLLFYIFCNLSYLLNFQLSFHHYLITTCN